MNEREFIASIDARFPYEARDEAIACIAEAATISPNACFGVAHELARLPRGRVVASDRLLDLLIHLDRAFQHPLKKTVLSIVERIIKARPITHSELSDAFGEIRQFPNQWQALNIAYFAAGETEQDAEAMYENITAEWAKSP